MPRRTHFKDKSLFGGQNIGTLSVFTVAFGWAINGMCFKSDPFFFFKVRDGYLAEELPWTPSDEMQLRPVALLLLCLPFCISMFAGAFGGATRRMRLKDRSPLGGQYAEILSAVTGAFDGVIRNTQKSCFVFNRWKNLGIMFDGSIYGHEIWGSNMITYKESLDVKNCWGFIKTFRI